MFPSPPFSSKDANNRNLARQVATRFMRLSKLSYLTLWAVHFDQVKKLYKDTLGLPVAEENENFIMFDTKGSRLAFHRLTKAQPLSRSTVERLGLGEPMKCEP